MTLIIIPHLNFYYKRNKTFWLSYEKIADKENNSVKNHNKYNVEGDNRLSKNKTRMEKVKFKIMSEIISLTNTGPKQN
jgi:hypothetical protein